MIYKNRVELKTNYRHLSIGRIPNKLYWKYLSNLILFLCLKFIMLFFVFGLDIEKIRIEGYGFMCSKQNE